MAAESNLRPFLAELRDPALEAEYRDHALADSRRTITVSLLVFAAVSLAMVGLDLRTFASFPAEVPLLLAMRVVMLVVLVGGALAISRVKRPSVIYWLTFAIVTGFTICYCVIAHRYTTVAGRSDSRFWFTVIGIFVQMLPAVPLRWSTLNMLVIYLGGLLLHALVIRSPAPDVVRLGALLLGGSAFGIALAHRFNSLRRQTFLRQCEERRLNEALKREIELRESAERGLRDHLDVLEQRISERAADLRASERRYRTLSEHSGDAIARIELDHRISYINRAIESFFPVSAADLQGARLDQAGLPVQATGFWVRKVRAVAGDGVARAEELEYDGSDGAVVSHWRFVPEIDAEGAVLSVLTTVRDITDFASASRERDQFEQQLRAVQRLEAIGQLAGGIAHDFNNLLTPILGNAELALMDLPDNHPLRSDLEGIAEAGQRAKALTRQLLAFARQQKLELVALDLNDMLRRFEPMLRRLVPENIEIRLELSEDAWPVRADASQMEQVLLNLSTNAAQAMPEGGLLEMTTANLAGDELDAELHAAVPVGPHLGLRIRDTGCGMHAAALRHIFDPFFTTKEQGQGTGLGLSTVLGIVRQHGGFIRAESEPGEGTLFEILLPAQTGAIADVDANAPAAVGKGTETILVVEDEAVVLQLARRILERNGYNVLTAQGGAEALELLAGHRGKLDLLLTDVIMPDLTGPEVWDRVRAAWPEARVLFCSGYTADVIARHGVLEVDIPFLAKPFTVRSLARRVREVLDAPRP